MFNRFSFNDFLKSLGYTESDLTSIHEYSINVYDEDISHSRRSTGPLKDLYLLYEYALRIHKVIFANDETGANTSLTICIDGKQVYDVTIREFNYLGRIASDKIKEQTRELMRQAYQSQVKASTGSKDAKKTQDEDKALKRKLKKKVFKYM